MALLLGKLFWFKHNPMQKFKLIVLALFLSNMANAQESKFKDSGVLELGTRSTFSTFSGSGNIGTGFGGQFRLSFGKYINTEWFADYFTEDLNGLANRNDAHIGWSVMFYPLKREQQLFTPYILAGHCFDYTKISLLKPSTEKPTALFEERWSSATQVGLGTHINLTQNFNLSVSGQYMIHLGNDIHTHTHFENGREVIHFSDSHDELSLEGHLLFTISLNYKIAQLW